MKVCAAVHIDVPSLYGLAFDFLQMFVCIQWISSDMQNDLIKDSQLK